MHIYPMYIYDYMYIYISILFYITLLSTNISISLKPFPKIAPSPRHPTARCPDHCCDGFC